jgi:hypothetical protein
VAIDSVAGTASNMPVTFGSDSRSSLRSSKSPLKVARSPLVIALVPTMRSGMSPAASIVGFFWSQSADTSSHSIVTPAASSI